MKPYGDIRAAAHSVYRFLGRETATKQIITRLNLSVRFASDGTTRIADVEFMKAAHSILAAQSRGELKLEAMHGWEARDVGEEPIPPYRPQDFVEQSEIAANVAAYLLSKLGEPRALSGGLIVESVTLIVERKTNGYDLCDGSFRLTGDQQDGRRFLPRLEGAELEIAKLCKLGSEES